MTIAIANVDVTQDTFSVLVTRLNQMAEAFTNHVVTVDSSADGNTSSGNGYVIGNFGADLIFATDGLRGGNTSSSANLVITSNVVMQANVTIQGSINFSGQTTISNTVNLTGSVSLSNSFSVVGNTTLANSLSVTGNSTLANSLIVIGNTSLANSLIVTGNSTLSNSLLVIGNTNLSNSLAVSGNTTLANSLVVIGNTTFSNNVSITGNLVLSNTTSVIGNVSFANTLSVIGNTSLANSLSVIGNTTLANSLIVIGNTTIANSLIVIGNTTLANSLAVTGNSLFSNSVVVIGNTMLGNTVLIGHTEQQTINANAIDYNPFVQIIGVGANASLLISRYSNNGSGSRLIFTKSRADVPGDRGNVNSLDTIGDIVFAGDDSNDFIHSAAIGGKIIGNTSVGVNPTALVFYTAESGAQTTIRMMVDPAGNVGIGLYAGANMPNAKLEVKGTANLVGNTFIGGTAIISGNSTFSNNVIITGNTTVQSQLIIVGNTAFQSNVTANGTVFATHFDNVSDIKLKYDINIITNAINILRELKPVSYRWIKDGSKSYGLIAQDVEKIVPEIVHENNGTKTITYIELIPLLISTIVEQQNRIEMMEEKLSQLLSSNL